MDPNRYWKQVMEMNPRVVLDIETPYITPGVCACGSTKTIVSGHLRSLAFWRSHFQSEEMIGDRLFGLKRVRLRNAGRTLVFRL